MQSPGKDTERRILDAIHGVVVGWQADPLLPSFIKPAEPQPLWEVLEDEISDRQIADLVHERDRSLLEILSTRRLVSMRWDHSPGLEWTVRVNALDLPTGERVYLQNDPTDDDSCAVLLIAACTGLPTAEADQRFLEGLIASNGSHYQTSFMGGWPSSVYVASSGDDGALVDAFLKAVECNDFTPDEMPAEWWELSGNEKRKLMASMLDLKLVATADGIEPGRRASAQSPAGSKKPGRGNRNLRISGGSDFDLSGAPVQVDEDEDEDQ